MAPEVIAQELDELAALRDRLNTLELETEAERKELLKPQAAKLRNLEKRHAAAAAPIEDAIHAKEAEIKTAVLVLKSSVKGADLHAVYTPPQPRWNDDLLQGLAVSLPAIKDARSESKPSVSIRQTK